MQFRKTLILSAITILINSKVFAYGDDEDKIDPMFSFYMILAGIAILAIGEVISQVKIIEGLGSIIKGIGLLIGGFGILGIALILFEWAMKTVITTAIYLGGLALVGYVFYQIYLAIFKKENNEKAN